MNVMKGSTKHARADPRDPTEVLNARRIVRHLLSQPCNMVYNLAISLALLLGHATILMRRNERYRDRPKRSQVAIFHSSAD